MNNKVLLGSIFVLSSILVTSCVENRTTTKSVTYSLPNDFDINDWDDEILTDNIDHEIYDNTIEFTCLSGWVMPASAETIANGSTLQYQCVSPNGEDCTVNGEIYTVTNNNQLKAESASAGKSSPISATKLSTVSFANNSLIASEYTTSAYCIPQEQITWWKLV